MTIYKTDAADVAITDLSITERVFANLEQRPNDVVLVDGSTNRSMTAADFIDQVKRLAGGLTARGLGKGSVVGLMSPNSSDYCVVFHAVAWAGGTVTTINPSYTASEVNHQLVESSAEMLITVPLFLETAKAAMDGTKAQQVVVIGEAENEQTLLALAGDPIVSQVPVDLDRHSVVMPYSSGITGLPLDVTFPEGYCIFDGHKVHSWSREFEERYSVILDGLCVELDYDEFLRLLFQYGEVRDTQWVNDPEAWLRRHCEQEVPYTEFVYRSSDGRCVSNRFIKLDASKWILTCTDITELCVDLELMDSQFRKYKRFASLASNWFWELDENLCYLYHSSHQQPLAGVDVKSLVGESRILKLDGMVIADDQLHEHNRCLLEHIDVNVVLSWQRDGGAVIYSHILAEPQFDEDRKFTGYLGSGRNITEQKELEKQISQSRKMESVGHLAAGIAHEINTPTQYVGDNTRFLEDAFTDVLEVLASYSTLQKAANNDTVTSLLLEEVGGAVDKADLEYLETEIPTAIKQSMQGLDRISKIVLAMKEFSHPGGDEKQTVDLNRIIENTIVISSHEWKYIAEIVTDFDSNLPSVPCDGQEISQVVLNLIVNAAHALAEKYGDSSGAVGEIKISTELVSGMAQVKVADTGAGMPVEVQSRVFDHFYTTKGVGKGTGQGLSMAYASIVERHQGDIKLESTLGEGTLFTIQLPLTPTEKAAA